MNLEGGVAVGSIPAGAQESVRFGEDFQVDVRALELRHAGRVLKLERLPLQVLVILIEQKGQLVTREEIAEISGARTSFSIQTTASMALSARSVKS